MTHGMNAICALIAASALTLPAGTATAQAPQRELSGEVTYLPRVALPEDALLLVEIRDPAGALLAEKHVRSEGRQVPLDFAVGVPQGADLRLRAGILDGLRTTWIGPVIAIGSESAGPIEAPILLSQVTPAGFPFRMRCGDSEVEVEAGPDNARLRVGHGWQALEPARSASGARYDAPGDPDTHLWFKGTSARVSLQGTVLPECGPAITPPPFPMTARGQEPGWVLTVADGQITHSGPYGADPVSAPLPAPEPIPGGAAYSLPDVGLGARITARLCRDVATGMPSPYTAVVTRGTGGTQTEYQGCGGDPMALLAGNWTVTEAAGTASSDAWKPEMTITPDGRIFGSGGCNRIMGSLTLTGEGLSVGPLASTMMACPEPVMAAERAFLGALGRADRFDLDEDGTLRLLAADGVILRAR